MTKQQALELLHLHMQNVNLRRHCYAVGAVMRSLAEKLNGNPREWEILGILHDADWEETKDNPEKHTIRTLSWLNEAEIADESLIHALKSHNAKLTQLATLDGPMEWALETCDELTGFIVAVALVRPDKTLVTVTIESVMKKWKTREFAKAVSREQIALCEEKLGIPLNEFIRIALSAMQSIHKELGL